MVIIILFSIKRYMKTYKINYHNMYGGGFTNPNNKICEQVCTWISFFKELLTNSTKDIILTGSKFNLHKSNNFISQPFTISGLNIILGSKYNTDRKYVIKKILLDGFRNKKKQTYDQFGIPENSQTNRKFLIEALDLLCDLYKVLANKYDRNIATNMPLQPYKGKNPCSSNSIRTVERFNYFVKPNDAVKKLLSQIADTRKLITDKIKELLGNNDDGDGGTSVKTETQQRVAVPIAIS